MKPLLLVYMAGVIMLVGGCVQARKGPNWDNIDFASIHCEGASQDNETCHPKEDPNVIGARSGKSK